MSNPLKIEFEDYQPTLQFEGEPFPLKAKNRGWRTIEGTEGRILTAFRHMLQTMQPGDKLTITFQVESKEN